jgi:hypothetical protein
MLKLKRIDLLTKNDKIHNKLEHGCCDHVQKYKKDDLCWEDEDIFRGVGGCLQFGRGELGAWGYISFYRWSPRRPHFIDITVGNISIILTVNGSYHCTEISVWIPRSFRR